MSGIHWIEKKSWTQVLDSAHKVGKLIFVDCYTTWCKPCRDMDNSVYLKEEVGQLMNEKFISIKVQFDTTKTDTYFSRQWRSTARAFAKKYEVREFPTFLFFSPKGRLVHKGVGAMKVEEFCREATNAVNPEFQYFVLRKKFQSGNLSFSRFPYLIKVGEQIGDGNVSIFLKKYLDNYLFRLPIDSVITKSNIQFLQSVTKYHNEDVAQFFIAFGDKINRVMGDTQFSRTIITGIINTEIVNPFLGTSLSDRKKPADWALLSDKISKKYKIEFLDLILLNAKENFYSYLNEWDSLVNVYESKYDKFGPDAMDGAYGNNVAMVIFEHSHNLQILSKAASWMYNIVTARNLDPGMKANVFDTYANVLHKLNRTEEAIQWEDKAIALAAENNWDVWVKAWTSTREKMSKGLPTWPN